MADEKITERKVPQFKGPQKLVVLTRIWCEERQKSSPNGSPWINAGEVVTKEPKEAAYLVHMRYCRVATKEDVQAWEEKLLTRENAVKAAAARAERRG